MARPKKTKIESIFSKNLKRIIAERQLTLKMCAELMGIPVSTLADWVNNSATPSDLQAVGRLCKKLNLDFAWLLLGEMSKLNASEIPLETLFDEEKNASFQGIYKISAIKLNRRSEEGEKK